MQILLQRLVRTAARIVYGSSLRGSAVAIVSSENLIVLVRKIGGRYSLPGGFSLRNERPEATAIREVHEETGLRISLEVDDGLVLLDHRYPHIHFLFNGRMVDPAQQLGAPKPFTVAGRVLKRLDACDPSWFPLDALPDLTDGTYVQLLALGLVRRTTSSSTSPQSYALETDAGTTAPPPPDGQNALLL